jgi:hypothetical protein
MATKTVVLKTSDVHQGDNKAKIVTLKTKRNIDDDIKRSERGSTDFYNIDPNTSIVIKILTEKKPATVLDTLICKDIIGSLNHYVCDVGDDGFSVLVENLLSDSRNVKLNFLVFYD